MSASGTSPGEPGTDGESLVAPLARLTAGARAWQGLSAAARASVATATTHTVVAAAGRWIEEAVAIKGRHETAGAVGAAAAAAAEETATGPLGTLRLLLITARALGDVARTGVPAAAAPPRVLHGAAAGDLGGGAAFVGVDVLPERRLYDAAIFAGHSAVVRCGHPGSLEAFARSWREEARTRPAAGGVCLVLGAGNVTGLAPGDCLGQIFEHGRAALLKLHPLHAPLAAVFREAFAPLVAAGMLEIVVGGRELAQAAVAAPAVTAVHLTGGQAAFDALVWGGPGPRPPDARPVLTKPITCELGNVTPWIVVPGRYPPAALAHQADAVAASILNNTSFNCIATKCLVTCRSWPQREEFLALLSRRLEAQPARPAWYPGATAGWESLAGRAAPADGRLPWLVRRDVDPERDAAWLEREWFLPAVAEVPLAAADVDAFCGAAGALARRLPGTLAASVTVPDGLPTHDRRRVDLLVEHLEYGVKAVNTWSALAYALGSVPWGGFPGGTLADPQSGIGRVHDPLLLPLVHDCIVRAPLLLRSPPPWFPWHRHGERLARGLLDMYAALARGGWGAWPLVKLVPYLRG